MWNKIKVIKHSYRTIEWNKWQNKSRREEILKTIEENSPPWAQEALITVDNIDDQDLNKNITVEEVRRAIRGIRNKNSSPGTDGIEYIMIKLLPDNYTNIITDIFNEILMQGYIPEEWRQYQVIFIDKTGKDRVRPISLSSCFGKLYERVINERLNWWAEHNKIYDKNQNGFRRGKSCLENIARLTTSIRTANYKNQGTLAAFLDVTAAYDNVRYNVLIKRLIKH